MVVTTGGGISRAFESFERKGLRQNIKISRKEQNPFLRLMLFEPFDSLNCGLLLNN